MNQDRFKCVWKILYSMYHMEQYGHMFKQGASIDSMYYYVADRCNRIGHSRVSKHEIKETLKRACDLGWAVKIPRGGDGWKAPSIYKFK